MDQIEKYIQSRLDNKNIIQEKITNNSKVKKIDIRGIQNPKVWNRWRH